MPLLLAQENTAAATSCTLPSAPKQGHLMLCSVANGGAIVSSGWTLAVSKSAVYVLQQYWKFAGPSESPTVTFTTSGSIWVGAYSGADPTGNPLDKTATGGASTTTTPSGTTAATTQADELGVASFVFDGSVAPVTFTNSYLEEAIAGTTAYMPVATKALTTAATTNTTASHLSTISSGATIATYKAAPRNTAPTIVQYAENVWNQTGNGVTPTLTWQAGDRIVVMAANESANTTLLAPTAPGLTFSVVVDNTNQVASNCDAYIYQAVAASNGSGAVTQTGSGGQSGICAWVWRGSDGIGARVEQHTTTKTVSLPVVDTHSALCWGSFDFSATAPGATVLTPTPTTVRESSGFTGYSVFVGDLVDKADASAVGVGVASSPSSGTFTIVGVEVLGSVSSGAVEAFAYNYQPMETYS